MLMEIIKSLRFSYLKRVKWRKYTIGKNMYIGLRVYIWAKKQITIGDNFYIGRDSQIETDCVIGDNVIFANKVALVGKYDHNYQKIGLPIRLSPRIRDSFYNWKGIGQLTIVEDDVWVGYGAIIMSGVKLGKGSIVAAGSVITKDTESYFIYGGNPARKISSRFNSEQDLKKHISLIESSNKNRNDYTGVEGINL